MTTEIQTIDAGSLTLLEIVPRQGEWNERDYLWASSISNRLVELVDGHLEIVPMPTQHHQAIIRFLFFRLYMLMGTVGGEVVFAPLRLRLWNGRFREPDILLLLAADDPRSANEFWHGADLVVEVVSPDKPERDTVEKVADYAQAGIPEYWIVNPLTQTITVLQLEADDYVVHGEWGRGEIATSVLLPNFAVNVSDALDGRRDSFHITAQ